jgi:hypothetical protein
MNSNYASTFPWLTFFNEFYDNIGNFKPYFLKLKYFEDINSWDDIKQIFPKMHPNHLVDHYPLTAVLKKTHSIFTYNAFSLCSINEFDYNLLFNQLPNENRYSNIIKQKIIKELEEQENVIPGLLDKREEILKKKFQTSSIELFILLKNLILKTLITNLLLSTCKIYLFTELSLQFINFIESDFNLTKTLSNDSEQFYLYESDIYGFIFVKRLLDISGNYICIDQTKAKYNGIFFRKEYLNIRSNSIKIINDSNQALSIICDFTNNNRELIRVICCHYSHQFRGTIIKSDNVPTQIIDNFALPHDSTVRVLLENISNISYIIYGGDFNSRLINEYLKTNIIKELDQKFVDPINLDPVSLQKLLIKPVYLKPQYLKPNNNSYILNFIKDKNLYSTKIENITWGHALKQKNIIEDDYLSKKKKDYSFLYNKKIFNYKPYELKRLQRILNNFNNINIFNHESNCIYDTTLVDEERTEKVIFKKICLEELYMDDKIYIFSANNISYENINLFPLLIQAGGNNNYIMKDKYLKYKKKYLKLIYESNYNC